MVFWLQSSLTLDCLAQSETPFCSASRLTRRLREERLDDFFQVGALAFRAVHLLGLVFLDGQHFAKFVMALAADVFVKGHRLVRLLVEGSVSFDKTIFLRAPSRASRSLSKVYRYLPCVRQGNAPNGSGT
jgi:hypothetical protein